jgi:hypothetical protein
MGGAIGLRDDSDDLVLAPERLERGQSERRGAVEEDARG